MSMTMLKGKNRLVWLLLFQLPVLHPKMLLLSNRTRIVLWEKTMRRRLSLIPMLLKSPPKVILKDHLHSVGLASATVEEAKDLLKGNNSSHRGCRACLPAHAYFWSPVLMHMPAP